MIAEPRQITLEDFIRFALLPENSERNLEFVSGEVVEKMPGSTENSAIAFNIGLETALHCRQNNLPCFVSTGDGAYRIGHDVIVPDFAFKPTPMTREYPDPIQPLWVVEVISPNDKVAAITRKRRQCIEAGILLREVYPEDRLIDVYTPGQAPATYGVDSSIDVTVIAGFKLNVAHLFAPNAS